MDVTNLPHVNASLNGLASVFIALGWYFIGKGDKAAHKKCMIGALAVSVAFLACYLTYHFNSGLAKFGGEGWVRPVYFAILIGHVILAVVITPLVPWAVAMAIKGRFEVHKKIVRWAMPLWLYVSVSGVVVYAMAIHLYPWTGAPAP